MWISVLYCRPWLVAIHRCACVCAGAVIIVSSRDEGDAACALSLIPLLQLCVLLQPRLSASPSIEATFKSRDCKLCVCTIKRGRIFKAENRYETYPTRGGNIGGFPQQLRVKFWPLLLKLLCCPSLQYVELTPLVLFNLWMKIFEHMRCVLLVLSIKYTTRSGQCANLHFKNFSIFKVWYGAGLHWPATDAVGEELHIQGRFRHIQGRCQDSGSSQSRFKWAWNIGAKEDREHRCEGRTGT